MEDDQGIVPGGSHREQQESTALRARSLSTSTTASQRKTPPSSSLLTKWPFFHPGAQEGQHDTSVNSSESLALASAVAAHSQQRKRTGSLRKTAILGPGKPQNISSETLRKSATASNHINARDTDRKVLVSERKLASRDKRSSSMSLEGSIRERRLSPASSVESLERSKSVKEKQLSIDTSITDARNTLTPPPLRPDSQASISTPTDSDDALVLPFPARGSFEPTQQAKPSPSPSPPSSESSLPQAPTQYRRRKGRLKSPLAAPSIIAIVGGDDDTWDYAETEWWGWIILVVTWIVFVVGMGSCLGIWSWAWDVGETPYAPPELEDDPTLPIVGYYPALMVLTAVMSWVWVVIAWIGMKYFKHATMPGEDV